LRFKFISLAGNGPLKKVNLHINGEPIASKLNAISAENSCLR